MDYSRVMDNYKNWEIEPNLERKNIITNFNK
jgi:hypothetical protein